MKKCFLRKSLVRTILPILLLSACIVSASDNVFRPIVEAVTTAPANSGGVGDTVLTVTVKNDPRLAGSLPIFPAQGQVNLLDVGPGNAIIGDNIYSAVVKPETAGSVDPSSVDNGKSLLINHLNVVESKLTFDPCIGVNNKYAAWSFARLMREMANSSVTAIDENDFVTRWMNQFISDQTVNSFTVKARTAQRMTNLIANWPKTGSQNQFLSLSEAPFRLLAIVNRGDLRANLLFGPGSAGELRFVFGAVDRLSCTGTSALPFTVIFEYGVNKQSYADAKVWQQRWHSLSAFDLSADIDSYLFGLVSMTSQVTVKGSNPQQVPNKSAINQVRTNEVVGGTNWELREFKLSSNGFLEQTTVSQTPDGSFRTAAKSATLAAFVNENAAAILPGTFKVPAQFNGSPFQGGAIASGPTPWKSGAIVDNEARHLFGLNTCSGCHMSEFFDPIQPVNIQGSAVPFTHIHPREMHEPADISHFLTGVAVLDPVDPSTVREFNELNRRHLNLVNFLNSTSYTELATAVANSPH